MGRWKKIILSIVLTLATLAGSLYWLAYKPVPEKITYGMSFNTLYARELGLDWQETYDAIIDDLGVRHLRLAAHWPMIEPERDTYNFSELDYQLAKANSVGADVVMAVGRRLPRWPECHVPDWAAQLPWDQQKAEITKYITAVVERYQDNSAITYWQVENEPYLGVFAKEHCSTLDEQFLFDEVALVHELDPTRQVILTDSGNLGTWFGAYKNGDAFGTSVYLYFWNPDVGPFKSLLPAWFYRAKEKVMVLMYGKKPTFLIELSAEPWLLQPVTDVDLVTQYERMNLSKINEIIDYATKTRYDKQYLWGAEWWYWLTKQGKSEIWDRGKELFRK